MIIQIDFKPVCQAILSTQSLKALTRALYKALQSFALLRKDCAEVLAILRAGASRAEPWVCKPMALRDLHRHANLLLKAMPFNQAKAILIKAVQRGRCKYQKSIKLKLICLTQFDSKATL